MVPATEEGTYYPKARLDFLKRGIYDYKEKLTKKVGGDADVAIPPGLCTGIGTLVSPFCIRNISVISTQIGDLQFRQPSKSHYSEKLP